MLAKLIQFSLTQRLLMVMATLALAAGGAVAYRALPIDAFPDVSSTQVKVIVKAPGMTPEEVEARITAPIEVEMLGIPHQVGLRSVAKYALTDITVDFEDGADIYWARQQVAERLSAVWANLPDNVSGGMAPMTTPLGEMFMFTVESDELSLQERRSLLDWVIRPQLRTVAGVADVNALGGLVRSFEIVPDNARMYARGVAIDRLQEVLQTNNRNGGAGRLNDGEGSLLVRSEGGFKTIQDVENTIVRTDQGMSVKVADVASVRIGSITRYGAVTSNGNQETVQGLVLGLRGANAQKVVDGVKAKLAEIAPQLPQSVKINVFYDRGSLVERAVNTVTKALLEAVVLVLILLVLFLGNFRAALTIAFILPLSALCTFLLMRSFGMSANLMSLGGLAIAIGMLVDAAVVVVENVVSHLADKKHVGTLPRMHIIYRAVREVSVPVTAGVLIIITVFLPLLTLQGLEGKLFTPVALTIMFALAGSLVLSLTVIPMLSSFLLKEVSHDNPWLVRQALAIYEPILIWCLAHAKSIVIAALAMLAFTGVMYTQIGKTFMPVMDEGDIIIGVEKLPSINLHQTIVTDMNVQRAILSQVPEVKGVYSRAGSDDLGLDPMGLNQTDNFLILKPMQEWRMATKDGLIDALRDVMNQLPGLAFSFTQPIDMRVNEMILGVRGDLAIKIFGPDLATLNEKAQQIVKILSSISGSQDVYTPQNSGVQYLQIKIDRMAAGRLGLSVTEIESILLAQLEGKQLGVVQEGQRRTPVLIRGSQDLRASPADFGNLMLTLANGTNIPLSAVAKIEREEGPVKVDREHGARMVVVTANVRDRDLVGFVEEAKQRVQAEVKFGEGYAVKFGGQFENQQRASARLAVVVPVAIGLIFLLLFATFGSVKQAVLILSNIPFAMIGGVFALWLSGEYLSVPASVGFIALLGIAVLNGVVMVSYFNQLQAQGMAMAAIVVEGAKRRLRPVLMTASIAAFGLIPLLFATGPGSEIQRPLAIVVIGGLVSSTLLTLVLLPILYRKFFNGASK
ncbi:MAG: CusA/CzcA family heavy metal efflux RND transporter [Methylotenera sp.]|uniref:efflux RND transporter permease subunit n=1 Tax=Methylotenera sp. TaxID=2051956 RepID=UPI000D4072AA|nr:CusA/CzcA family heavy metal efflux RND transporter [Methylotenera sp.]PPC82476.1 MAG: CusA/CzcA family heavy metal efflux RND transporter [Methylotenera sp.]